MSVAVGIGGVRFVKAVNGNLCFILNTPGGLGRPFFISPVSA